MPKKTYMLVAYSGSREVARVESEAPRATVNDGVLTLRGEDANGTYESFAIVAAGSWTHVESVDQKEKSR